MTDEIRKRAACDRCHAHKLKCSLDNPGQAACNRCLKAQKECFFSPFRQKKTLENVNYEISAITNSLAASSNEQDDSSSQDINNHTRKRQRLSSQREEPLSIDQDSTFEISSQFINDELVTSTSPLPHSFNFHDAAFYDLSWTNQNPFLPIETCTLNVGNTPELSESIDTGFHSLQEITDGQLSKHVMAVKVNEISEPRSSLERTSVGPPNVLHGLNLKGGCVRKLSQLNVDLFEHSSTVPPITTYYASTGLDNHQLHGSTYALEDTFRLTQDLIDIYPTFLDAFITQPIPQSSNSNPSWSNSLISNTDCEPSQLSLLDSSGSKKAHENSTLDYSSILLIISVHLRLIGIYETVLHHMKMCFKPSGTDMNSRHVTLETARIPNLKLGSYTPPPSAAVPMQMLLFVNFGSQLFKFATDLASGIQKYRAEPTPEDSLSGRNENSDITVLTGAAEQVKNGALKVAQGLEEMRHQSLQMSFTSN